MCPRVSSGLPTDSVIQKFSDKILIKAQNCSFGVYFLFLNLDIRFLKTKHWLSLSQMLLLYYILHSTVQYNISTLIHSLMDSIERTYIYLNLAMKIKRGEG